MNDSIRGSAIGGAEDTTAVGTVEDRQLDRLVDGELGEGQRRVLLEGLDNTPDGWKRCALAFLAAQAWRQAIVAPPREVASPPRRRTRPAVSRVTAVAAAVLIAFAVGALSGASWRPPADRDL